jgi:PAS domain S-box-containing protein
VILPPSPAAWHATGPPALGGLPIVGVLLAEGVTFQGLIGWLIGPGLLALGAGLMKVWDRLSTRRKDAIGEWQAIAAKAEAERDECTKESRAEAAEAEKRYDDLHAQYVREQLDSQLLRGQNKLLQSTVDALRAGVDAAFLPGGAPPAWVKIDEAGIIRLVGPYVFPIVHYEDHELVGRPARILVPPEHRAEHDAWLASARDPANVVDAQQVYPRKAFTKQGETIPVFMRIRQYWEDGRRFYTVLFWERMDGHSADDIPVTITVAPVAAVAAEVPPSSKAAAKATAEMPQVGGAGESGAKAGG